MLRRVRWPGRVRAWWQETPSAIRWVTYISVPIGFITVGLGVYGDYRQWWEGRSFLTNLVSSFASLLFGVPTALVVLAHLSGMQAEAIERRSVQRSARQAAADFEAAVLYGFRTRELVAAAHSLHFVRRASRAYRSALAESTPDARQVVRAFHERQGAFEEHLPLGLFGYADEWVERISMGLLRLDDIRPRVADAGINWIGMGIYRALKDAVQKVERLAPGAVHEQRHAIHRLDSAGATIVPGPEKQLLLGEASSTDQYLEQVEMLLRLARGVRAHAI